MIVAYDKRTNKCLGVVVGSAGHGNYQASLVERPDGSLKHFEDSRIRTHLTLHSKETVMAKASAPEKPKI